MPTVKNQVLMTILDQGQTSSKELAKHLNLTPGSAAGQVSLLKKQGLIEHVGYSRWGVTQKGQEYLRANTKLLTLTKKNIQEETAVFEAKQPEVKPVVSEIDWAREYIYLSRKVADKFLGE